MPLLRKLNWAQPLPKTAKVSAKAVKAPAVTGERLEVLSAKLTAKAESDLTKAVEAFKAKWSKNALSLILPN